MDISSNILLKAQMAFKDSSDANVIESVRNQNAADNDDRALRDVAEDFEAIFIKQIFEGMRRSKLAEDPFNSSSVETYTSLMDDQMSKQIALSQGFGIAEALVAQLSSKQQMKK